MNISPEILCKMLHGAAAGLDPLQDAWGMYELRAAACCHRSHQISLAGAIDYAGPYADNENRPKPKIALTMPRCLFVCALLLLHAAPCVGQDLSQDAARDLTEGASQDLAQGVAQDAPQDINQAAAESSASAPIRYIVLGKSANHRQLTEGVYALLNYHFFAEIVLAPDGLITDVRLSPAKHAETLPFAGSPPRLTFQSERYASMQTLNQAYPAGDYVVSYVRDKQPALQSITLGNAADEAALPFPVVIYLSQDGKIAAADAIDAEQDLEIAWSPFDTGKADPQGIADDWILVLGRDCHGALIDHSGLPFSQDPPLTFAARQHSLPAAKLYPGESFQLRVRHARLQNSRQAGVARIASFSATSILDIQTLGTRLPGRAACPALMPEMNSEQGNGPQAAKGDLKGDL